MSCPTKEEVEAAVAENEETKKQAYETRMEKLKLLDQQTRVPHLLIELRSLGFVEIQGKNTGGIYDKLSNWLKKNWRATDKVMGLVRKASDEQSCFCCGYYVTYGVDKLQDHQKLCDRAWQLGEPKENGVPSGNNTYKARGDEGENNMGKLTMKLAQFMTNECGWTLQVCDAGNLGYSGEIREQQLKFKAPHPLNLVSPLVMIELRQVGYIEVNGSNSQEIFDKLGSFFASKWQAKQVKADPDYCDLKYRTDTFKKRGGEGENNMGQRTMELVDFMVKECQWTMVTCNGGNFGRKGDKREQQLIFRNDEFVQHGADHIMVELRTVGYIEINGLHDAGDTKEHLINFMVEQWGCKEYTKYFWEGGTEFCDLKYTCPDNFYELNLLTNNLGKRTLELAGFLAQHGWALMLCNGGSVTPDPHHFPNNILREQQVKFTKSPEKAAAPLLLVEFRTQPANDEPPQWHSIIEIVGPDTNGVYAKLHDFITEFMGGQDIGGNLTHCDKLYHFEGFELHSSEVEENGRWGGFMNGESNIGQWTMRLCDYMVDHLGEWDLIVCNSDNLSTSFQHGSGDGKYFNSVTAREMQMVFRHRPGGRAVFMAAGHVEPLGRPPLEPPPYWTEEACVAGTLGQKLVPGSPDELAWMQEILDKTFKNKVTRDRKDGQPLADRYKAVQCIRSEHPGLWDRFAERRRVVSESCKTPGALESFTTPKTTDACPGLAQRCTHVSVGNPANQAYLLHGTNPTSAVAILNSSFTVNLAGKSAGTMFGPGVYLAESSTKADEYARDDVGGEYDGLYAVLVCRALLGRSYVTEQAGDFSDRVLSGEFEHVLGDREKAVGTFREFIFFHEASIYPEYAVFYRREKDGQILPPPPRMEAPAMERMEGVE
ncbi:pme-5, partial [Symbiodinium natans]